MKNNFLLTVVLILSLVPIFLPGVCYAQPPQYREQLNQIFNDNQFRMHQQMQMQMNASLGLRMGNFVKNYKYKFTVVLKDSTKKLVNSKIFTDTALHKNYLLFVDKSFPKTDSAHYFQKIYPQQTAGISYEDFDNKIIKGNVSDSCWMFKVISGPITAYSFMIEQLGFNSIPLSMVGLQLNDGPIISYTKQNLKQMLGNDSEAMEIFESGNFLKAIKRYNRDIEKVSKK